MLFIGTRYSNLYTAVDTPDEAVVVCLCLCVSMCSDVLGPLSLRTSGYASSDTSAFSLRLMSSQLAAGAILTHSG